MNSKSVRYSNPLCVGVGWLWWQVPTASILVIYHFTLMHIYVCEPGPGARTTRRLTMGQNRFAAVAVAVVATANNIPMRSSASHVAQLANIQTHAHKSTTRIIGNKHIVFFCCGISARARRRDTKIHTAGLSTRTMRWLLRSERGEIKPSPASQRTTRVRMCVRA